MNTPRGSAAHPLLEEAMRLHQQGNLDQACNFYAEFLQQQPAEAQALRLYGIAARESGQPELSLKLLIQLAQVQPDSVVAYDEIALTYMASGLLDDASRALDHALSIEPNNLRALTNKGALLHFRGHSLEAIQVYREALSVEPTDIEIRCNLAKALAESGDAEQGLIECETAIDESDEHPLAVSVKATILADTGQHKEASELFESLREYASFDESILINLGFSYQQTGAASAALKAWREAVDINPHNARAVSDLTYGLINKNDSRLARELCEGFLLRHPGEPLVVAALAYALAASNDESYQQLLDYQNLVYAKPIALPAAYKSIAQFNAELANIVTEESSLTSEPLNKATTGGSQTGELNLQPQALAELETAIRTAVTTYCENLNEAGLAHHQALSRAGDEYGVRAWGTVLASGGRQTPHMHPTAWISGVYYVAVPDDLTDQRGAIQFGLPPERAGITNKLPENFQVETITPEEGLLVLFPSYMYHQTLPFESSEARISIAFDALPFPAMAVF